jgi:hypothetical protein
VRLAIPAVAIGNESIYRFFLSASYEAAQQELANSEPSELALLPSSASRFERFKEWLAGNINLAKKVDAIKERGDALVGHIVKLAAVFIIQTVVLPLLFLWLLVWLCRTALRSPAASRLGL